MLKISLILLSVTTSLLTIVMPTSSTIALSNHPKQRLEIHSKQIGKPLSPRTKGICDVNPKHPSC